MEESASDKLRWPRFAPPRGASRMSCGRERLQPRRVMDELRTIMQDAVRCHFEPQNAPRLIRIHLVKDDVIPV